MCLGDGGREGSPKTEPECGPDTPEGEDTPQPRKRSSDGSSVAGRGGKTARRDDADAAAETAAC